MTCGACGPTENLGEASMYKALEQKVRADEEERKRKERERRVSMGLPAQEEKPSLMKRLFGRRKSSLGSAASAVS